MATGRRGDGRGEVKGLAEEDAVRASGPRVDVEPIGHWEYVDEYGVPVRVVHGAGDLVRAAAVAAPRDGGGCAVLSVALFHCQSAPRTASSSSLPFKDVGAWLSNSSSWSVFSSSASASLVRVGRHKS